MKIKENLFKYTCVVLCLIIVLSSFIMVFAIPKSGSGPDLDFFSCNDIVNNIKNMEMNMTSVIYVKDSNGEWQEYQRIHGNENRIWVGMDKIPQKLIDAFIAIEDQRYYTHGGVDWKRTAAAFINWLPSVNILSGNQGGSTITQQLIKNITSDNDQNASRKFREIARALVINKMLSKDTILEAYLNTISLGNGICGVQVAANYYFNKDVSELSLVECAAIAGITKNPSAYNPIAHPEANETRRRVVLDQMYMQGKITLDEYNDAYYTGLALDSTQQKNFEIQINNYFVDALIEDVIKDLSEKYDCSVDTASSMLYNGGYKIYATMDQSIQSKMEKVYKNVSKYFPQKSKKESGAHVESAMTIMDYEGHIVGIVGGTGTKTVNRCLNRAMDSPRQPGSTMKPLGVYAPAIDKGYASYSSVVEDKPLESYYPDGKKGPQEWYGYYAGTMTLRKALERSANTIPCHILKDMGIDTSYEFLTQRLHLNHLTEVDKNLASLALGGCQYGITTTESAAAYAIFGNGGLYYEPTTYYKVENSAKETILTCDVNGQPAIQSATATIMNKLLQNVVYGSQGTGRGIASYSKMKVYAKTGTSSESNDLWMVAGTPYYVGSVWYGFDKLEKISNQSAAATVWKTVMTEVHKDLEFKEFVESEEVIEEKFCKNTGLLAGDKCTSTETGYCVPGVNYETCNGKHTSWSTKEPESSSSESSSSSQSTSSATSSGIHFPIKPPSSSDDDQSHGDTSQEPRHDDSSAQSSSDTDSGGGGNTSSRWNPWEEWFNRQ